jgi:hypothetical protein
VFDLPTFRAVRNPHGYRSTLVQSLPTTMGNLRGLRTHKADPGGSLAEPLCATCTRSDPSFWRACPTCGDQARIRPGRPCVRCTIQQRLRDLLGDHNGTIRPELQALLRQPRQRRTTIHDAALVG